MPKQVYRVFIGVGHGGPDAGAVRGSRREADYNLSIALLLKEELQRHGLMVKLSRERDEEDRLQEEIAECNAFAPDAAIEIHTNAGGGSGFEVYYQTAPWENSKLSMRMAQLVDKQVKRYLNVKTRGLKTNANLGWLKQVKAPCILVENFFIDGPQADWYSQPVQLAALSKAYAHGILEYFGIAYRSNKVYPLRMRIVNEDLETAKEFVCPAILQDGSNYVNLRIFSQIFGRGVYYQEESKTPIVYPTDYFAPSDFQSGLLKLSDFPTEAERLLAGISIQEAPQADLRGYSFDEYGYGEETGRLEQYHRLEEQL